MKKILVIKFKDVEEAILSSGICKSLKDSYENSQVDYVLYEEIAPFFKDESYINSVISISKEEQKNIFKYLKKVWKITRNNYDIIIDTVSTPKSELFSYLSPKAQFRIGKTTPFAGKSYTHQIDEPTNPLEETEKFLHILDSI